MLKCKTDPLSFFRFHFSPLTLFVLANNEGIILLLYVSIVSELETNDCLSALDLIALLMLNFEYASFFS